MDKIAIDIQRLIPSSVEIGLYLYDTKTKETLCINENKKFPLASLAKWIVGSLAFHKSKDTISPITIKEAISNHSREAYDSILEKIDIREINIELQQRDFDLLVDKDNTSITKNCGTPASVFQFMKFLYEYEDENMYIFESLKEQEDPDGFRFSNQYEWLHMTGGLERVCNDVGYLYLEDRVLFCIGFVQAIDKNTEWYQLELVLKNIGDLILESYKVKL